MLEFKKGELVVFKTHPFIGNQTNIKITAYSDYTPPILVVKEIKDKSFDKETGKDIGQQLNCIYYNSKDGKFIEKWINSNLINKIILPISENKILIDLDLKKELEILKKEPSVKNYENLIKELYFNKKVVLKNVNVELNKIKVNRTKDNGELLETNHLEFLPPIMTIIGFKFCDDKNKFCENTGSPLLDLKCKWYNSSTKTFSEYFLPYKTVKQVIETQELVVKNDLLGDITESIEDNSFFLLPINNSFELEDDAKNVKIVNTLGQSHSILYKHYFYQMNYFDFITQKKSAITIDQIFTKKTEIDILGNKYPRYNNGSKLKTTDCKFKNGNYYSIIYEDAYKNRTRRIVKIKDLIIYIKEFEKFKDKYKNLKNWNPNENPTFVTFSYHLDGDIFINLPGENIPNNTLPKTFFDDDNLEIIIITNCLLRRGKIRNFKLKQISEVHEILDGENLFEYKK